MTNKDRQKRFKRAAARNGMYFFTWLMKVLPFCVTRFLMDGSLRIAFFFAKRLKKISRETLAIAFGNEKSPEEVALIIRKCFDNLRHGMVGLLYHSRYPEKILDRFTVEGMEHLDRALAKGKGVLAVTAHFGNFPLMMLYFSQRGYDVNCIMRRARDEDVGKYVLKTMDRTNVKTIYSMPRRECVTDSIRALRNNGIVFVLLDQHFGAQGGVFVDFFGQKAATATGPVVLAERTEAPILMMFNVRRGDSYHLIIEPELELKQAAGHDETVLLNTSRITRIIEGYIRKYPEEWGWMHRRFKGQAAA